MTPLRLVIAALSLIDLARAQDHLEPEESIFSAGPSHDEISDVYHRSIVAKFGELYADYDRYKAQAIVIPSFENEWAVAIETTGENLKIVYLSSSAHLWAYALRDRYERDAAAEKAGAENRTEWLRERTKVPLTDVAVARCEVGISPDDGKRLLGLWESALRQTRYPAQRMLGLDGITYHFAGRFDYPPYTGQIWSPEENTNTAWLVEIVESMREACVSKDPVSLSELKRKTAALCRRIGC